MRLGVKKKLLVPKFDNLQKHARRQKCKVPCLKCAKGKYFMLIDNKHAKTSGCGLVRVETPLLRWCVLGELLKTINANSFNLLLFFGS
jgi:hypothetical protein